MIWHHPSSFSGCCEECKRFHALSYLPEDDDDDYGDDDDIVGDYDDDDYDDKQIKCSLKSTSD